MASPLQLPSLIAGTAIGGAAVAAFEPALEVPRQEAWATSPNRLPDVGLIAALVAGGKVSLTDGQAMAKRLGYDTGPFDSLTWLAQNRLDFPVMLRMWRLAAYNPSFDDTTLSSLLDRTLAHEQLDWDYHAFLRALKLAELPGIGDIAYAVVRGYLPTDIALPVAPPSTSTNVKRFPQSSTKAETLAAAIGYDQDILELMIARSGLSMAPGLAAQARFRKILADDDYHLAIAEGDLRTEWADALLEVSREIPTLGQMMEHSLRGFEDLASAKTNAQRHGTVDADAQLVYDNLGRAPNIHAVTTGLARGGNYDGTPQTIPEPFLSAVRRADIRPEWYGIEYANRYTYPSAFVLRALAQAGDIGNQAAVEQVLLEIGWKPDFAKTVSTAWVGGTGTADKNITSAQTHLKTATHKSYIGYEISDPTATSALEAAGVAAASVQPILALWKEERSLVRKSLTAANLKKALSTQAQNPATGVAWTQAEVIARLLELGYNNDDALTFLEV